MFQLGKLFAGAAFTFGTGAALCVLGFMVYMLVRKNKYDNNHLTRNVKVGA